MCCVRLPRKVDRIVERSEVVQTHTGHLHCFREEQFWQVGITLCHMCALATKYGHLIIHHSKKGTSACDLLLHKRLWWRLCVRKRAEKTIAPRGARRMLCNTINKF